MRKSIQRKDISTFIVLEAVESAYLNKTKNIMEYIEQKIKAPRKVIYAAIERECDKNFLEYGVSLAQAWLTMSGKIKLQDLREINNGTNQKN